MKAKYDKAKFGAKKAIQTELERIREKRGMCDHGTSQTYLLGVIDGLILAAGYCCWPTRKKRKTPPAQTSREK